MIVTTHERRADVRTAAAGEVTWEQLTGREHVRRGEKDGRGVTFASYLPSCACGGDSCQGEAGHRIDANVLEVHALGLDIDKRLVDGKAADINPVTAEAAIARIAELGLRAWIYSTHSATAEKPSLRAIVALSRPVARADWRRFWHATTQWLGIYVQTACQNEARFWYLPSAPEGAEVLNLTLEGQPLDVDAILASAAPATPEREKTAEKPFQPSETVEPWLVEQARAALRRHGPAVDGNEGDPRTYQAACICRDHGIPEEDALGLMLEWNATCQPPWDEGDLETKVRNAYRYAKGEEGGKVLEAAIASLVPPEPEPVPTVAVHVRIGEAALRDRPPIRTYATGITDLDRLLGGGLSTRQLMVLGAPPGDGKSALAVTLSLNLEATLPVLYVSTELETDELVARVASQVLGVSWRDIVRGRVEAPRVRQALAGKRIWVVGCDVLPRGGEALLAAMASAEAIAAAEGVPPLVILDYMQDLARGGDEKSLRSRVGDIATALRVMSQRLDCPLLAVCSVSRTYYGKQKAETMRGAEDATVYLAAMKESGDVDYAAATVLFLDVEPPENGVRLARIAVSKARHGETGFAGARFYGATGRWEPDMTALVALAPEERAKGRQASEDRKVEQAVLEFVRTCKRGTVNMRSLRANVEPRSARVDEAAQRLVDAGTLDELGGARGARIFVLAQPA